MTRNEKKIVYVLNRFIKNESKYEKFSFLEIFDKDCTKEEVSKFVDELAILRYTIVDHWFSISCYLVFSEVRADFLVKSIKITKTIIPSICLKKIKKSIEKQ